MLGGGVSLELGSLTLFRRHSALEGCVEVLFMPSATHHAICYMLCSRLCLSHPIIPCPCCMRADVTFHTAPCHPMPPHPTPYCSMPPHATPCRPMLLHAAPCLPILLHTAPCCHPIVPHTSAASTTFCAAPNLRSIAARSFTCERYHLVGT